MNAEEKEQLEFITLGFKEATELLEKRTTERDALKTKADDLWERLQALEEVDTAAIVRLQKELNAALATGRTMAGAADRLTAHQKPLENLVRNFSAENVALKKEVKKLKEADVYYLMQEQLGKSMSGAVFKFEGRDVILRHIDVTGSRGKGQIRHVKVTLKEVGE